MTGLSLVDRAGQTVRVALGDPLAASARHGAGDLRRQLSGLLAGGADTLVIDVSGVERLSSGCVATLLGVQRTCHARRVRVVLADPSGRTHEVLSRSRLASVFEIES